ncbi:MAG: hypothetical protein WAV08_08520, partial [Desulfobacterales bacterium]
RNELIRRHHRHDDDIDLIGSNAALKELFDQRSRWGWVTSGASCGTRKEASGGSFQSASGPQLLVGETDSGWSE